MNTIAIRSEQVEEMLHAIGYEAKRVKRGKYKAFRNGFMTPAQSHGWDRLVSNGYATREPNRANEMMPNAQIYHVTRAGMDFLEGVTGVKIIEDD